MGRSKRVNFTKGRVDGFTCPPGKKQVFLWDDAVKGLGIRATAGSKSYIYQGAWPGSGQKIRITLGAVGALTLEAAREAAQEVARKLTEGIDPREERREQAAERAAAIAAAKAEEARWKAIMAEAWAAYVKAKKNRWSPSHLEAAERMVDPGGRPAKRKGKGGKKRKIKPGPLAGMAQKPLVEITPEAVQAFLEKETPDRPTYAALCFRHLRAFLNWCSEQPDYESAVNPDACGARVRRNSLPTQRPKDDCLQREQLKGWFTEVKKLDPSISAYLQGLLLTGARRRELAPLRWSDVDFKWRSMTIHDKVDGRRTVPLTPYLAAILYALPRRNECVFSSPRKGANPYVSEPRYAHKRACTAAGIEGLSIHGLRRSFGTLAEWTEAPVGVVAQIMGHKPSALAEKHYRRRPLDLLRLWHVKIEGWILEQAGIPQPAEDAELGKLRAVK